MIELTAKEIKKISKIGARGAYGYALKKLIEENEDVYAVSADLGSSSGLQRLMNERPERFLNIGIAEQNMIGVCAGLAKEGLIPFASSFAPFITMRCLDQIKMNLGYMGLNIKLTGLGSGFALGELGNSHYGLEDIAIMRAIPQVTIINPADCGTILKTVYAVAEYDGPVYIRLTGTASYPIVYGDDFDFQIGKGIKIRDGKDIAIIACGSMVKKVLEASEILEEERKVSCTVVDMHTIKPLDKELLNELCENYQLIVTVEEHSIVGGLGGAVAECLASFSTKVRQLIIGVPDLYGHTGSYEYQLNRYGLTGEKIAEKIWDSSKV